MDTKILNARKKEILEAQSKMLQNAVDLKVALTATEEAQFTAFTNELDSIAVNLSRYAAIEKGQSEVGQPRESCGPDCSHHRVDSHLRRGWRILRLLPLGMGRWQWNWSRHDLYHPSDLLGLGSFIRTNLSSITLKY